MAEKTVPWWRRALSYALGGIRSGFGLFSVSEKNRAADGPERFAGREENSDKEAELTEDSPKLEEIVEAVNEAEAVPAPHAEDAAESAGDAAGVNDAAAESVDAAVEAIAKCAPATVDATEPAIEPENAAAAEGVAEPETQIESNVAAVPETEPEGLTVADPQQKSEAEEVVEADAVDEAVALSEPDQAAEEVLSSIAAEVAPVAEQEIIEGGTAADGFDAIPAPAIAEEESPEPESVEEHCAEAEAESPFQDATGIEEVAEAGEEIIEPAEPIDDIATGPEAEELMEPVECVEVAASEEPAPELTTEEESAFEPVAASVESIESAMEEPLEQTALEPAAEQVKSVGDEAPAGETALEIEHAPEQAAEQEAEPASAPEEFLRSTAKQKSEPMAADETKPVEAVPAEEAASQPAPAVEQPAAADSVPVSAAEPAIPSEEPAAEVVPKMEAVAEAEEARGALASGPSAAQPAASTEEPTPTPQPAKPFIKLETRDNEANLSPFSVVVSEVYDGPLDLLLDLIRKQDIDVYDIPIARITAQFLAYVNQLKATDVDVAGEFIYMASLLIHIKSKMLLPRAPTGPDEAAEDPRRELVERLLEHERFKNAAQMLQQKQMLEAATWTNPGVREFRDDVGAEPEIAADTVDLVRVFRDILERARSRPVINVEEDSVTVGQMIQFLARRLTIEDKPIALRRLLSHTRSEKSLIAMFLALLELVRLQAILLRQDRAFSEIFIKKHTGFDSVMNEGLEYARDDWK